MSGLKMSEENLSEEKLPELAELFKYFSDPTRIRIMFALMRGEANVGSLAEQIDMSQSAVSHQLAILKAGKLVKSRRDGKAVCYSLADEHVRVLLATGMEHISE